MINLDTIKYLMRNEINKIANVSIIMILFLILSSTTAFAQKTPSEGNIDKDPELVEAMKEKNYDKGLVNYTVMKAVFQKKETQQVSFNVKVDRTQDVMIEVFDEEGTLIQVLYNDNLTANKPVSFIVQGEDWVKQLSYYIRVTTEDHVENHEVVFD